MSSSAELLVLRLALIGIIFIFALIVALTMRSGLRGPVTIGRRQAQQHAARFVLIFPAETGLDPGAAFPLAGVMSIGRDPQNSIIFQDPSVSAEHAMVEWSRDGWRVRDLGSTNGTTLNGHRVDGRPTRLRGGEQLAFGAVVLRFER
ncbi:MAG TPA: FHA domain-containing protein [Tepidiformaceae bacterium]|nr:FHA domain-containing protein [Tepidiformaceae bacterium]